MSERLPALLTSRRRDVQAITWYRLVRVIRKILARMEDTLQEAGISRSQFDLLMQIAFQEGINQQMCANRLNVTKGNVAQQIARLEASGFVRRQNDGRDKCLQLTAPGQQLLAEMLPAHDQQVSAILAPLSEEEIKQFQNILRRLDRGVPRRPALAES